MTPQQLRNSILQMAIEGKLTEQRAEDGNASDLLKEIKAEKAKLIAEKKIKKEKSLPEISEDEIPFEIPDNWVWTRLGDIAEVKSSKRVYESDYVSEGIPFFRSKEIGELSRNTEIDNTLFITKNKYSEFQEKYGVPQKNDILITSVGSIGNIWISDGREFYYKDGNVTQVSSSKYFSSEYIKLFFESSLFTLQSNSSISGTAYNALTIIKLKNIFLPLPPLAEQKRIVARLEEILPQVDEYEKAYNELQELNKKFPDNLKNSLLQMAIEGKLVDQRAEDGNARDLLKEIQAEKAKLIAEKKIKKEKPLPEISEDEIPFEIPDNWVWCKLGAIGYLERGSGIKRADVVEKGLPCIRYGELYTTYKGSFSKVMSFTSQEIFDKSHKGHSNDIFMALTGENKIDIATAVEYVGKMEIAYGGDMTKLCCIKAYSRYIMYLLNSPYVIDIKKKTATGDIIVHISNDKIANFVIPLPPLAEQKRIVAKLEQILPLCDELSKECK